MHAQEATFFFFNFDCKLKWVVVETTSIAEKRVLF